jgi:metal-responsive CopG/Arc/MetJ family transcriptional regulator
MTKPMQFGTYKEMTIRIPVELCDDFEELSTRMKVSNSQFVTSAVTYFILRMNESQRMDHTDEDMRL